MPKRKPARTRYTDDDRATALAALAANGGDVQRTARELGMPRGTLQNWAKRVGVHPAVAEVAHQKQALLADRLEEVAHQLVGCLTDEARLADASLQQVATALGIAIDKMQLLRGKPTAVNDTTHRLGDMDDAELDSRIAELENRLPRPARGEGPPPGPAEPG